jgi:predicted RNase H-like HicB family nuclease
LCGQIGGKMTFKGTIKIEQEDEAMVNLKEAIALYYDDETKKWK